MSSAVGPLDHPELALVHVQSLTGLSIGVLCCLEEQLGVGLDGVRERLLLLGVVHQLSDEVPPGAGGPVRDSSASAPRLGSALPKLPSICLYFRGGHSIPRPSMLKTMWVGAVLVHLQRLAGLAVDDLDGLEEGTRVPGQDALADGVLNVSPVQNLGQELLDRSSRPVRGPPAAATGLCPALSETALYWRLVLKRSFLSPPHHVPCACPTTRDPQSPPRGSASGDGCTVRVLSANVRRSGPKRAKGAGRFALQWAGSLGLGWLWLSGSRAKDALITQRSEVQILPPLPALI